MWQRYDPFVLERPANREARGLLDAARQWPLADDEFSNAIGLLGSGEMIARLTVVAILELEAGRSPERKRQVVAA